MYYFTADLHLDHSNIIKHCSRPFSSVDEMNETLIQNWNEVIQVNDIVVVVGDFTLHSNREVVEKKFVNHLKGNKIFLKGDHDHWLGKKARRIYQKKIGDVFIVACHWPMRSWKQSHHGSIQIHGHWHKKQKECPNQFNVGVDLNNFKPVSLDKIIRKVT